MFIMKYFNAQFRWTFKVYVHITVGEAVRWCKQQKEVTYRITVHKILDPHN